MEYSGSQSVVPWNSLNSSITWVLARNVNSQAPSRPTESEILEVGLAIGVLTDPLGDSGAHLGLRPIGLVLRPFHLQKED